MLGITHLALEKLFGVGYRITPPPYHIMSPLRFYANHVVI